MLLGQVYNWLHYFLFAYFGPHSVLLGKLFTVMLGSWVAGIEPGPLACKALSYLSICGICGLHYFLVVVVLGTHLLCSELTSDSVLRDHP